jgi:ribonuclease D
LLCYVSKKNFRVKEKYKDIHMPMTDPLAPPAPENRYFIDDAGAFATAVFRMRGEPWIAFDQEADSMFHFTEKVCLIQMAMPTAAFVIDPLAVGDLSLLADVLSNPAIVKILHGADYDIRCLYRDFGITLENLFDTELAARFLGEPETGLNALVGKYFGITLEKKYQKKDWSVRPLSAEMIAYAADDVRYLIPLYHLLRARLEDKNRLDWVLEECGDLSRVRYGPDADQPLFLRIKGAGRLEPQSLAVLEALLAHRLQIARQKDRPPFKIIGNETLLDIARTKPGNLAALENTRILSDRQRHMYGKQIITAVQSALSIPSGDLPRYPRKPHAAGNGMVLKKFDRLKRWRAGKAEALGMDPGVLISNAILKTVAENHAAGADAIDPLDGLKRWQKHAFGAEIIRTLTRREKKDDGNKNPV